MRTAKPGRAAFAAMLPGILVVPGVARAGCTVGIDCVRLVYEGFPFHHWGVAALTLAATVAVVKLTRPDRPHRALAAAVLTAVVASAGIVSVDLAVLLLKAAIDIAVVQWSLPIAVAVASIAFGTFAGRVRRRDSASLAPGVPNSLHSTAGVSDSRTGADRP